MNKQQFRLLLSSLGKHEKSILGVPALPTPGTSQQGLYLCGKIHHAESFPWCRMTSSPRERPLYGWAQTECDRTSSSEYSGPLSQNAVSILWNMGLRIRTSVPTSESQNVCQPGDESFLALCLIGWFRHFVDGKLFPAPGPLYLLFPLPAILYFSFVRGCFSSFSPKCKCHLLREVCPDHPILDGLPLFISLYSCFFYSYCYNLERSCQYTVHCLRSVSCA